MKCHIFLDSWQNEKCKKTIWNIMSRKKYSFLNTSCNRSHSFYQFFDVLSTASISGSTSRRMKYFLQTNMIINLSPSSFIILESCHQNNIWKSWLNNWQTKSPCDIGASTRKINQIYKISFIFLQKRYQD